MTSPYTLYRIPPFYIFFGTSEFAVYVLEELIMAGMPPALIITAPDRPSGRGLKLTPSSAKLWAEKNNIKFIQPEKLSENIDYGFRITDYDFAIVAAYGKIIPKWLIDSFSKGILNIHPSLLPKYRGPSPVQSQILADDRNVGVSIMLLDDKIDHGPIIANCRLQIADLKEKWPLASSQLEKMLAHEGGRLLVRSIPKWLAGEIKPIEQDHGRATFTKKIIKQHGLITLEDVKKHPYEIFLKIRAYDPWPGTYFFLPKQLQGLLHMDAKQSQFQRGLTPLASAVSLAGSDPAKDTAEVNTGNSIAVRVKIKGADYEDGKLKITRVIPEGGREVDYDDFMRSYREASF